MKLHSTTYPNIVMDSIVLEEASSSGTACIDGGGGSRAIDRHNPIIRDEKRLGQVCILPSSSSAMKKESATTTTNTSTDQPCLWNEKPEAGGGDQKRKSVALANDDEIIQNNDFMISPASSSRCLLSDHISMSYSSTSLPPPPPPLPPLERLNLKDGNLPSSPTSQPIQQPPSSPSPLPCDGLKQPYSPPHEPLKFLYPNTYNKKQHNDSPPHEPPPYSPQSSNQVVVLEVALHCRGCERKMKKHISKIEGVTSFKIEFAAKKVTVVGDVTPLAVLTSVLKVKNAKLLSPATISSSAAA